MLLMAKELEAKLENYPICSQGGLGEEADAIDNKQIRKKNRCCYERYNFKIRVLIKLVDTLFFSENKRRKI